MRGEKVNKNHIIVNHDKDVHRQRRNILRKGSITVESALVLPLFICAIVTIMYIMKVVYIHETMQHALNETAEELSMYSYIYNVTGLKELNDSAKDNLGEKKAQFQNHLDDVAGVYNMLGETVDSTTQSLQNIDDNGVNDTIENIKDLEENIKNGSQKIEEIFTQIKNDPKSEVISLISFFADSFFEKSKAADMTPAVKLIMKKYLLDSGEIDLDEKLRRLNIKDGISGLDFSESKFFEDKETIMITVEYEIVPALPIKLIPDIKMKQTASVRAWLSGIDDDDLEESSDNTDDTENIWELGYFKRGNIIRESEGANLPHNFPAIDTFDKNTGEIVNIRSIDPLKKTYSNSTVLKSQIKKEINKVKDFTGANQLGYNITENMIKSRKVTIVFPIVDETDEVKKAIKECEEYADKYDIKLDIKHAYGAPGTQQSTDESEDENEE